MQNLCEILTDDQTTNQHTDGNKGSKRSLFTEITILITKLLYEKLYLNCLQHLYSHLAACAIMPGIQTNKYSLITKKKTKITIEIWTDGLAEWFIGVLWALIAREKTYIKGLKVR